jgi:hypothetical protein
MGWHYAGKNIRVKRKNILTLRFLLVGFPHARRWCRRRKREAPMLKLSPIQPPEAPAKHEALVTMAGYRKRLENCPDDRRGDWHEAATTAWTAMLQFDRMVSQLLDMRFDAPTQDGKDAIDHAIDILMETAGTLTAEAERKAEDDAVNGAFYRAIDAANMRADF